MKLVHVIPYFQPELGYQEYYLAKEHVLQGHDVTIITSEYIAPYYEIINLYKKMGYSGRNIKEHKNLPSGLKVIKLKKLLEYDDLIFVKDLKRTILKVKPDAVFAHEARQGLAVQAAYVCSINKIPFFSDQHDYGFWLESAKLKRRIEYKYFRRYLVDYCFFASKKIFFINYGVESFLKKMGHKHYQGKTVTMGQSVDIANFYCSPEERQIVRARYDIADEETVIAFFGKLSKYKKIELIFKVLEDINEKFAVMIVGGGEENYLGVLKKQAEKLSNKVVFTNHVPVENLRGYYSAADICVFPHTNSVTIIEAMASECAVLLSRREDCMPYVDGNGFLFEPDNVTDLKEKLQRLLSDNHLLSEMKFRSKELAADKFNYTKNAEEITAVIST